MRPEESPEEITRTMMKIHLTGLEFVEFVNSRERSLYYLIASGEFRDLLISFPKPFENILLFSPRQKMKQINQSEKDETIFVEWLAASVNIEYVT